MVSKSRLTQVGRALKPLGIGHIAAYSPEARGRCERAFRTLQDRLPKELRLAGISTVEAANRFLREVDLPEHNARFATPPDEPAAAFVPVPAELWRDVLCVQEERPSAGCGRAAPLETDRRRCGPPMLGNDNRVRWRGRTLQIPPSPLRPHFVRATGRIHDHPDGSVALLEGPHRLVTLPAAGTPPQDLAA